MPPEKPITVRRAFKDGPNGTVKIIVIGVERLSETGSNVSLRAEISLILDFRRVALPARRSESGRSRYSNVSTP